MFCFSYLFICHGLVSCYWSIIAYLISIAVLLTLPYWQKDFRKRTMSLFLLIMYSLVYFLKIKSVSICVVLVLSSAEFEVPSLEF